MESLLTSPQGEGADGLGALAGTVRALLAVLEARDTLTYLHSQRMADLAAVLAGELGLSPPDVASIRVGALLHDIGMIAMPIDILSKPRELSISELAAVTGHPVTGYAVLRNVPLPLPMSQAVLQHHERLDGSGYPHGLKGDAICRSARILAVADTVESMVSERPYRDAPGIAKAFSVLERGRGLQFDAKVVDACLRIFRNGDYRFPERFPSYLNPDEFDLDHPYPDGLDGQAERGLF